MMPDNIRDEMDDLRKRQTGSDTGQPKKATSSGYDAEKAKSVYKAHQSKTADKKSTPASSEPTAAPEETAEDTPPAILAEHTVASGETLSHIALNYYKSAAREKWMAIYEANKEVIGDNPSHIRVGQVLQIPNLDEA